MKKALLPIFALALAIGFQTVALADEASGTVTVVTEETVEVDTNTGATQTVDKITTTQNVTKTEKVVNSNGLNVRDQPGTSGSKVIATLKRGASVDVVEKIGDWYKINYSGGIAYVYALYVGDHTVTAPVTTTKTVTTLTYTTKTVTAGSLNVRNAPSPSGQAIGHLDKGETVVILEQEASGWVKIKFNSAEGFAYVYGQYLK